MSGNNEIDDISGVTTTGHEWDGIKELNNPMPRWWLWTLYATIIWSIGYTIVYPAWPGLKTSTKGLWEWSSRGQLRTELSSIEKTNEALNSQLAQLDINAILADDKLRSYAVAAGASLYKINCVQCHGSGAQGGIGYPNLNDDSWLWGGTPDQVLLTLKHGVRSLTDADTRDSMMPSFGKDGILEPAQIIAVTNYVLQMGTLEHDAALAATGATIFAENCVACHGEKGEGNVEFGAPQLNDAIWLYGGTPELIKGQVIAPRHGMMPAWEPRLGETKVKQLAAYVMSLGGGTAVVDAK
jgi:cytochrome c oxidase cbb3-type subunit III